MIITLYLDIPVRDVGFDPSLAMAFAKPAFEVNEGCRRWRLDLDTVTRELKARPATAEERKAFVYGEPHV